MRKPDFRLCDNKDTNSCAVNAQLISAFVFATLIVPFLFYLNPKFQASSHLPWFYISVCDWLHRNSRTGFLASRLTFSHAHMFTCSGNRFVNDIINTILNDIYGERSAGLRIGMSSGGGGGGTKQDSKLQGQNKPGCTVTEYGYMLEISDLESRVIVLST